jgi:hypothetical protein
VSLGGNIAELKGGSFASGEESRILLLWRARCFPKAARNGFNGAKAERWTEGVAFRRGGDGTFSGKDFTEELKVDQAIMGWLYYATELRKDRDGTWTASRGSQ